MTDHDDEFEEYQRPPGHRPNAFWYPALILAFVVFAAIALAGQLRGEFGWGLVLGLPVAFGVIYGYGAYEISLPPWFSVARLSLLDRGYVFALVHPRGGGELGRGWYLDGKLEGIVYVALNPQ